MKGAETEARRVAPEMAISGARVAFSVGAKVAH